MSNMRSLCSLRLIVPSLVLLVALISAGALMQLGLIRSREKVSQQVMELVTWQGHHLQGILDGSFRRNQPQAAADAIASLGIDRDTIGVFLIDDDGRIIMGTNSGILGSNFRETLFSILGEGEPDLNIRINDAMLGGAVTQITRDGRSVLGTYPIVLGAEPGQLRPHRLGVLLINHDLQNPMQAEITGHRQYVAFFTLILALLAGGLTFVLQRLVTRRIANLVAWSRRFALGELTEPGESKWRDEIGELSHAFAEMARRVTDHHQAERGQAVKEREGLQKQLLQSEKLAAVGQLAGGIAHDFNNILTGILGHASIIARRTDIPAEAKADAETTKDLARRAAKLVSQILDFSRQSIVHHEPLSLEDVAAETIKLLQSTLPENIRLRLINENGPHIINGDHTRIQQVLTNLAVNARDAMPRGGSLTISLGDLFVVDPVYAPCPNMVRGAWAALQVSDTGTGIAPEHLNRIFEPFFTTKEPGKGTGLGLAQVYGIVGQLGGQLKVDSHVGQGTTFTIYFPRIDSGATRKASETRAAPRGRGEQVLIVEDEACVLTITARVVRDLGYSVLTARNAEEALKVHRANRSIRMVLSDITMPGASGIDLAERLSRKAPGVRVVLMTGYMIKEASHGSGQTVFAVLQKPIEFAALARVLGEIRSTTESAGI